MKIAEALVQAKDLKGKIAELTRKLQMEALFEKLDDTQLIPDNSLVLDELVSLSDKLSHLKTVIARTNSQHRLTDKINEMEQLRSLISQLDDLSQHKQERVNLRRVDYEGPAVKISTVATYNVDLLSKRLEGFRSRVRELDLELQKVNWTLDLVE